ncbi:protein shisa-like-2A [Acipenser oxyrinchus oxyrinchus]|uniref:Protein shisa-like-2A n=1 Tax=Acipenser oxyrinchus oxyrinchus TaxID=40147 RepID=A0AAD8DAD1_ACIOX|nr:protein shisa-like-2A [Acipenser oxyrinchus oxyrinchus]
MSSACLSYYSAERVLVEAFTCPKPENDASAVHCCGFNDMKYCCDDPNSFFPYEYEYMWWLRLDNGLPLHTPGSSAVDLNALEGPSHCNEVGAPTGIQKHFMSRKLDCTNQPPDQDRLFQRCFTATVTTINVEGPS